MGLPRLSNTQATLAYLKQRSTLFLLAADHLAGFAANIYLVAALILVSQKIGSGVVLAEVMLITQASMLVALPIAGMVSEKLGALNALTLSLALFSLLPMAFFLSGVSTVTLRVFSAGSGVAMALNLPSSAAFTYTVVPKKLLPRIFIFIMATSAIDSVGILLSPCLFGIAPIVPFAVASSAFLLCAVVCRAGGMCALTTCDVSTSESAPRDLLSLLRFCGTRKFLYFAAAQILYGTGFYVLLFLIPMRVILPQMRGHADGSSRVAVLLSLIVMGSMLTTIVVNYVIKFSIKTIRATFVMMGVASVAACLTYQNPYALSLTFSLFAPLLFTGRIAIFSLLGRAFDVRSPGMQGAFLSLALLGGVVAFASVNVALRHVDMRWIVSAYGSLCLVASVIAPALGLSRQTEEPSMEVTGVAGTQEDGNARH